MRTSRERRFRAVVCSWALVSSGFVGCASDGGGQPSGGGAGSDATPDAVRDMCRASCARSARCNTSSTPRDAGAGCVSGCTSKLGDFATGLRSDVVAHLEECFDALACGMSDDPCTANALVASGESVDAALHASDVERCLDVNKQCAGTPGDFSDDTCGILPLLVTGRRAALARCFEGDCSAVAPCLQAQFGPSR